MNSKLKSLVESIVKEVLKESSDKEPSKEQIDATFDLLKKHIARTRYEGKVFVAGGAVRDMIMGKDPKDIDVVVEMEEGGIKFANYFAGRLGIFKPGSNPVVFADFGMARVHLDGVVHNGIPLDGVDVEFVLTREEEYQEGSRKPTTRYGTIKQDVFRRDLTINSLLMDLVSGEIVDLTGQGRDDIAKGVIRTPSEPNRIFQDDPLRLLRAVRFAGRYNFTVPEFMRDSIKANAKRLTMISRERVHEELMKILSGANPDVGMRMIYEFGLSPYVLPLVTQEVAVEAARRGDDAIGRLVLMMSHLKLADVVKSLRDLKFSNDEVSTISTVAEAIRMIRANPDKPTVLQAGSKVVKTGNEKYLYMLEPASKLVRQLMPYFESGPVQHVSPNEFMDRYKVKPGAVVGKMQQLQKELWFNNPDISREEVLDILDRKMSDNKL